MAYLVRTIVSSFWDEDKDEIPLDEIPANAIGDLKTKGNKLSLWRVDDLRELDTFGASIYSGYESGISKIMFVLLPFDEIEQSFNLEHSPEEGKTAIIGLEEYHYNISNLNYKKLGKLALLIRQALLNKKISYTYKVKNKKAIEIIKDLKEKGKVAIELLGNYARRNLDLPPKPSEVCKSCPYYN